MKIDINGHLIEKDEIAQYSKEVSNNGTHYLSIIIKHTYTDYIGNGWFQDTIKYKKENIYGTKRQVNSWFRKIRRTIRRGF